MPAAAESWAVRALRVLAAAVYRYPRAFFYPQALLFLGSLLFTVEHLEFHTSRNELVDSRKRYHQNYLRFRQQFPGQDDLVAVVESEDREKNRQFVERLGARLETETNLFTDVFFKGDLKLMGNKALLFLDEAQLTEFQQTLRDYRPFIQQFGQATNLNSLFRLLNRQFRTARRETNAENESLVKAIPALARIVAQASDSLQRPGTPPSPGLTVLFGGGEEAEQGQYITFATNRIYLVTARAARENVAGQAVERLRELVRQTQAEVPGLNVGITGEPVLEVDEMAQSQRDTTLASAVSLALCALIFIYGYAETGRPVKATLCLVVGLGYTLGYTTLAVGHLNILTITFLPILIGLAIDFGVHLVTRYEEELRRGRSEREAMEKAMVNTGLGIFTGCFTTAGAFLAMGLTDFKGIREMGIICGGGLLVCLVPMLTLLPVLLLRGRQNALDHTPATAADRRARLERLWLDRPVLVAGLTFALCLLAAWQARKVTFDYNLLNLQSKGLPAVVFEHKLIDGASKSVLYGAMVADSLEQAVDYERRALQLPSVASVDSITRLLTEDQSRKLALIRAIKADMAAVRFAESDLGPVQVQELDQTLQALQGYLTYALKEVAKDGQPELGRELAAFKAEVVGLRERVWAADPDRAAQKLGAFQHAFFADVEATFEAIRHQDDHAPLRVDDLPQALRNRFVGVSGHHYLLQVNPRHDVWQRAHQEQFVRELRTIDPDVTGTPVQLLEYTALLKESYEEAAWYALGAIALLVFVHFRRLSGVVLALLPVGVGYLWMLGLMGWWGVPFNPANIMTLPLVVGIGVTNGIHILNRFAEEQNPGILAKSTGKAVLVSALTTIAGFGSLSLAQHRGIASLGMLMAAGTATCMVAALTFLPALLNWLMQRGWVRVRKTMS